MWNEDAENLTRFVHEIITGELPDDLKREIAIHSAIVAGVLEFEDLPPDRQAIQPWLEQVFAMAIQVDEKKTFDNVKEWIERLIKGKL